MAAASDSTASLVSRSLPIGQDTRDLQPTPIGLDRWAVILLQPPLGPSRPFPRDVLRGSQDPPEEPEPGYLVVADPLEGGQHDGVHRVEEDVVSIEISAPCANKWSRVNPPESVATHHA